MKVLVLTLAVLTSGCAVLDPPLYTEAMRQHYSLREERAGAGCKWRWLMKQQHHDKTLLADCASRNEHGVPNGRRCDEAISLALARTCPTEDLERANELRRGEF